jgi:hypothetical protein
MKSYLRQAAAMVSLLGSAGFVAAQTAAPVELTPQQRNTIYQTVSKEKSRTPLSAATHVSVGAQIPASVELYTLPDQVVQDVPSTKLYKYTVWNDQVVLVDPTSMRVIEVIRQ